MGVLTPPACPAVIPTWSCKRSGVTCAATTHSAPTWPKPPHTPDTPLTGSASSPLYCMGCRGGGRGRRPPRPPYLHRVDPSVPIEETIGAMGQLVEQGSVHELGVCELSSELLERAASTHPLAALQSEWSLFTRDIESGPLNTARRHGLTVVAYSPLGRGMLTGEPASTTRLSVWDVRRFLPRWRGCV